jgi:hypothetical protein
LNSSQKLGRLHESGLASGVEVQATERFRINRGIVAGLPSGSLHSFFPKTSHRFLLTATEVEVIPKAT